MRFPWGRAALDSTSLLWLACLAVGCGQSPPPQVAIEDWCTRMETAIRDRAVRCECPGNALDDAGIAARCATLNARTLLAAYDVDEIGWHGGIASARVAAIEDCESDPAAELLLDDPVLGDVAPGEACRIFDDVWGRPDDCAYGAVCAAPIGGGTARCITLVAVGESCDDAARACAPGLVCGESGVCTAGPEEGGCEGSTCAARGDACDQPSDCVDGVCSGGVCAAPVCDVL